MKYPDPYYIETMTCEEFILRMISLGTPTEISLVGVFDELGTVGRGSRKDIELPLHKDGEYSQKLAEAQGNFYIEQKDINIVGLYCLKGGINPCYTLIQLNGSTDVEEIKLEQGEALIFHNQKLLHGRKGPVGDRILIRFWVK